MTTVLQGQTSKLFGQSKYLPHTQFLTEWLYLERQETGQVLSGRRRRTRRTYESLGVEERTQRHGNELQGESPRFAYTLLTRSFSDTDYNDWTRHAPRPEPLEHKGLKTLDLSKRQERVPNKIPARNLPFDDCGQDRQRQSATSSSSSVKGNNSGEDLPRRCGSRKTTVARTSGLARGDSLDLRREKRVLVARGPDDTMWELKLGGSLKPPISLYRRLGGGKSKQSHERPGEGGKFV